MTKVFEIEKPFSHLSYTSMVIKYIVLFIVIFLGIWFAVSWLFMGRLGRRFSGLSEIIIENSGLISIIISLTVIGWFIYRAWRKYNLGEVFRIEFDDVKHTVTFWTINVINDSEKISTYSNKEITYQSKTIYNSLFGKQRIVTILNNGRFVHEINLDRTAWCRHDEIDHLVEMWEVWSYPEEENYR